MLPADVSAALDREISQLVSGDRADRAANFAGAVRTNVRFWERFRAEDPKAWEWAVLDAYRARRDCDDHSSPVYADRVAWLNRKVRELVARDGGPYVMACKQRLTLVYRVDPYLARSLQFPDMGFELT
jgi:hypothetical protein